MDGIKSGLKTSEFWLSAATTAWALLSHALPPLAQTVIGVGVPAVYSITRAIVKAQAVKHSGPGAPSASVRAEITTGDP